MSEENKKIGFIVLYRSIRKNWLWEHPDKLKAWLDILLEVNHAPKKVMIKGKLFICDRGESLNSLKTWAKRWGWSINKVKRFLLVLESDSMIELKTERQTTSVTVCNYESYQGKRNANETQKETKREPNENQTETNNNDNKENNEKNKGKRTASRKPVVLPFNSESFSQAWVEWQSYRKEIKKPLTQTAITKHLNQLEKMGEQNAKASIDKSISNGWTGLFEIEAKQGTNKTPTQREAWRKAL
jgi:hypothetical protein